MKTYCCSLPLRRFAHFSIMLLLGVLPYPVAGDTNSNKVSTMNDNRSENSWCVGRFQFALPANLILTGRSQSIYGVELITVPIPTIGVQALWASRLTELQTLQLSKSAVNPALHPFELLPGVSAVWYQSNGTSSDLRSLESMKPLTDHILSLKYTTDAGKESLVETLMRNVINTYQPGMTQGFCAGYGSITSEPGFEEDAVASFQHNNRRELSFRFESHTVSKSVNEHPLFGIDSLANEFAREGSKLTVLKDNVRSIAGLIGRESRASLKKTGKPSLLRYTWHYPGTPSHSDQPELTLQATAKLSDQAELQAVWESLLKSLSPVPKPPNILKLTMNPENQLNQPVMVRNVLPTQH